MTQTQAGVVGAFFVPGRPRTKGSLTPQVSRGAGGKVRVHLVETGEHSVTWKRTMIKAIWAQCGITPVRRGTKIVGFDPEPYAGPVNLVCVFKLERVTHWPSHDTPYPTAVDIGDLDKLERNLLDALTQSGLISDDRLVVAINSSKRWCEPDEQPGVQCSSFAMIP